MKATYRVGIVLSALVILSACANSQDISALNRANCNRVGFDPHSEKFNTCLQEQRRQTTGSALSSALLTR